MREWCPKAILLCLLVLLWPAHLAAQSCQVCMAVLDPTASQAFTAGNGATATLSSCGLAVNSDSSTALTVTGGAHVTASSIQVVGGYSINNGGSTTPTPTTGAPPTADPFANVPSPSIGTCLNHPNYTQWGTNGTYQIYPGTYCGGLAVSNGVTGYFNPGVYVIDGGGIQFGSGTVIGSGVTFYITGTSFTNNQLVSINNGMTVNLSAPTSGTYQGLLFFQDRTINNTALSSSFGGGASMTLTGAMDFPTTALQFNNGSSSTANVAIIGRTVSLEGGVGIKLNSSSPILPPVAVSVAPTAATLYGGQTQQFSASVANACSGAVTWSISPSSGAGSISSSGLYSAPAAITTQQTATITATSASNTAATATATVVLEPPISVSVAPATATLYGGQTQQFTATVTNATNTAVTWLISPSSGAGTVSSSGLYTVPATIAARQTVTLTATSVVNTAKTATATILLEPAISVAVSPTTATLYASQTQQFTATVSNTSNTAVTWSISPSSGAGTISAAGLYTAPANITAQQTVTVTATSQANTAATAYATVTLTAPVSVSVNPTTATLYGSQTQQFTATVSNTSNTAVTWSISPSSGAGTISSSGLYTAPASIGTQQTITVTATSQANTAATASATVTLTPPISVSVSPATATLYASQTQQFSAAVSNTSNTAVTWSISPSSGAGTISSSGLYTTPASIGTQQTATVTASSQANTAATASATVTLSPAISVSLSPTTATLYGSQTQQFTATVSNTSNTAVTWSISPTGTGTISSSGLYTAPASIAMQQTITVTATSQANTAATASATVTLSPAISVSVGPATATLYANQTQQFSATVLNTSNTAVNWSISPSSGAGTIGSSGLYTAPASVASQQTVTVTATSQANNAVMASATITLAPSIAVSVSPATITLDAGQTQQFTATVSNTSNTAVTWSISPSSGAGAISSSGLYTAPASITQPQTVTVTATSAADGTTTGSATVNLAVANTFVSRRVNAGGPAYIDSQGLFWAASNGFTYVGSSTPPRSDYFTPPSGTNVPVIDQTLLYDCCSAFQYQTAIPNGQYVVTLFFADPFGAGEVFDVTINGVDVLPHMGVPNGQYTPWNEVIPVTVTNGQITIVFSQDSYNAFINAIQIVAANSVEVLPPNPSLDAGQVMQFSANVEGQTNQSVTWAINPSVGSVSSSGLYTAPLSVATPTAVTVTATSVADASLTGSAVIGLNTSTASSFAPLRVNAGGPAYTDPQGLVWAASSGFTYVGSSSAPNSYYFAPPSGTSIPVIDQTLLYDCCSAFQYQATLPNGQYVVTLFFADPFGAGEVFDVTINGVDALPHMGVPSGQYTPWTETIPVNVTTGQIAIVFSQDSYNAFINAIQIVAANSVEVLPLNPSLDPGQFLQFTANVQGETNQSVTWAVTPNVGSISSSGVYTAPSSVAAPVSITVSATSVADPNLTGSSVIALTASTASSVVPLRVNAGGPSYTDPQGLFWAASNGFTYVGSSSVPPNFYFTPPAGITVPLIDQTGIYNCCSAFQYQSALPNGQYVVTLFFADPFGAGEVLDVTINGVDVLPHMGVPSGQYTPWTETIPVNVTNGQITIVFSPDSYNAFINAIQIVAADSVQVLPYNPAMDPGQVMQFTANVQGQTLQTATWAISPNVGSISSSGLYTAPLSLSAPTTVTVMATSVADPNLAGVSVIGLNQSTASSFAPLRVNAGGPAYTDPQGLVWAASNGFTYVGSSSVPPNFSFNPPSGSNFPVIDQTGLYNCCSAFQYQAALPNGQYVVTLFFADPFGNGEVFDVTIDGVDVLPHMGVPNGQYTPWTETIPVNVTNGQITIVFSPDSYNAFINAIQIVAADSVEVLPLNPALDPTQTLQFTANVQGQTNQAVTWGISPAVGSISSSGLYTAPLSLSAASTVTVTATSVADPNLTGSSAIGLNPAPPKAFNPLRVNAGGLAYTDPQGLVWSASNGFTYVGSSSVPPNFSFTPPTGSNIPVIYQTGIYNCCSAFQYQTVVPNGQYIVTLFFADPFGSGEVFDVTINGVDVLPRMGVPNGQYTPWTETIPVNVTNGLITIVFSPDSYNAFINALQIVALGAVQVSPSTASLFPLETQQFTAEIADPANPGAVWTIAPTGVGSVSSTGLYTAPSSVAAAQTVTVTATDAADSAWSNSATVNLVPANTVLISPASVTLNGGQSQQFTALVNGGAVTPAWSISPSGMGTISATGLYTAPAGVYSAQTVTLTANIGLTATATITLAPTANVSVGPANATLGPGESQQFTATVTGAWNTGVTWTVQGPGAISSGGVYTAPATIATATAATLIATSTASPGVYGSATVTLLPAVQSVSIAVMPGSASLAGAQTQQFSAIVTGTANTAVTWSIAPAIGSISTTGLYTAPANIGALQTVVVQAASVADPSNFASVTVTLLPGSNGYSYRRPIAINHTYVPNTDQTNLPVLISGTYSYLANVANGGNVQNANGYDIIFSSDCAGLQKLNHEIESYNAATGAINMWVQIPTVSHTTDTVFYISYGNSSIATSQENKPGVWDRNYQMVLHLSETAAPYLDSTGNAYSSTGGIYPTAAAGKIGGGQSFDGLSQYIAYSQAQSPNPNGAISMEAWVNVTGATPGGVFGKWESDGNSPTDESYELFYRVSGQPSGLLNSTGNAPVEVDGAAAVNDGNWHHVAVTAPPTGTASIYVDGVLSGSLTNTSALLATTTDRLLIGATSLATGGSFTHGSIDEVRISNSVRSPDWIAAEYASENSPSTFYTIYPANANSIDPPSASLGASQTQQFTSMFTVSASARSANPLVLLGVVQTPSSAESVAIDGNTAYVCDANEVSIINIANLSSPTFLGAALASSLQNDGINDCSIQNNSLVTFIDTQNSALGDNPSFVAFGLENPMQPQLIASTEIDRRFFAPPVYLGNTAFVPTFAYDFFLGFWTGQNGDVLAVDLTNLASPNILGTLETPTNGIYGGNYPIFGVTLVNNQTLYAGSTTSDQATNDGVGQLMVVNISNPAAMSTVTQVQVPGTKDLYAPMIQGNLAVAGGDNGGSCGCFSPSNGIAFVGNFVITTFDITNPTSPVVLATVTTAYQGSAGSAAIGPNLFLFSVFDSNLNPVLLLVDTTDPANPVISATYNTPARINQMLVAGNILHTADGLGGYAIYQIPGSTPQQYNLTASCAGPANWVLNPAGVGSISSTGLYTAPASLTGAEAVTVTATSQSDPTETASATVSLSQVLTTSLTAVAPGPYLAGTTASFLATVTSQGGNPVQGITVNLTVTGANGGSYSAVTGTNGQASFSYTGIARGADTLVATPAGNADPASSPLLVLWISPVNAISTTAVTGEFFASCPSGCQIFTTPSTQTPVFLQNFPNVMFDPPSGLLANNTTGVTSSTLPFTDIVVNGSGATTGTIIVQGNGLQAGVGTLAGFSAVFRGSFVVQAGSFTFNVASEDGFIFGVGNGAVRISGVDVNPPTSGLTVFSQYPVMGANNWPPTNGPTPIVISFPASGSYPYEIDYQSGVGGDPSLAITVTQGSGTQALSPLDTLTLAETSNSTLLQGQQATFTIQATDETGAAMAQLPVVVSVTGTNPQTLNATTNSSGQATVSYSGTVAGADLIQASATTGGQSLYSNQAAETWSGSVSQAPTITVVGDSSLTLPSPGVYQATVTDPDAPAGGTISVSWSEVSGPGTATFSAPTALSTASVFSEPGGYVLQVTATDLLGSQSLQLNVTVNPAPTVVQGWLATPVDGSTVTGVVPITLASGISLTSGTLSYWPVSNPNAVVVLNSNTVGGGTIGTLDTTLLANGGYIVELSASTGGSPQNFQATVTVVGNYKPGRLTTTVTDLTIPAPGLPIQIQRTYDSLVRSTSLDFGNGWSLGVDVQLEVSPQSNVTLTLNQQTRTFYFTPLPVFGGPFAGLGLYKPAFTAEPGFYGSLTASLDGCIVIDLLVPLGNEWMCASETPYQPQTYTYTDPYGRVYTISASGGLQSIKDLGGNTLTVTPGGIASSNGLSVPFVRDSLGRITQITDTLGNNYLYGYDGNGNLATVTYPGIATPAQYTYDSTNLYTGGTDSRGNPLPVTSYDTSGRLQTVTNALNQTTSYAYDLTGQTTTVTYPPDANGNVGTATMVYDGYGDLLTSTDPLGLTTTYTYDANHDLLSVTDPLGHTNSYTYDVNGNRASATYPTTPTSHNTTSYTAYNAYGEPSQTTDPLGNITTFAYDSNFWPQLTADAIGPAASFTFNANGTMAAGATGYDLTATPSAAVTYTYDQYGNLASQTDALGRQTQYAYDTLGRQVTITAPLPSGATPASDTTTNIYDALSNLTGVDAPLGRSTSNQYDANGNKIAVTDADGHTTSYQYDVLNRVTQVTYPTSPATAMTYAYDFRNNVINTTDQAGHVAHNVYDLDGRLTSTTLAYGTSQAASTSYTYYNDGRKATQTDPLGHTTAYNYDPAGRMIGLRDAQNNVTLYVYDDANNRIQVTDPNGHKTQSQYDARHRLTQVTYDNSTTAAYNYDRPGNLAGVTDQAGNTVQYAYDYANQLLSVVQPASPNPQNTTSYSYDVDGNLVTLTDANGHATLDGFDLLNELNAETMPTGSPRQTRTYDPAGNLVSSADYNGKTTNYTYDPLNRLLSRTPDPSLPDTPESFTYTPTGKRASMSDASGTTIYTYDSMDRLIAKATPQGTLNYTYDTASNVASMVSSNANGISVQYAYDTLNRLSAVVDNRLPAGANTTTYTYDPASNLVTAAYPNGTQSTVTYDDLNRLTALNGTRASYSYTLGPTGYRTAAVESSGRALAWSYDGIYRLTSETITLDPHSNNGTVAYGLDPVGNRLSQTSSLPGIASGAFTYNVDDRLSTDTYDNNGNTLVSGANNFTYDFENRLKSMNSVAVTNIYDGDGNRVAKTVGGVTTRYLVDDLSPTGYAQVVEELVSGAVQRTYAYGLQRVNQDQLMSGRWTPSFYEYDGLGSVRTLTDSTGSVTDTYDYDAWGNTVNVSGSTPNLYLYRGEQYDPDLRLYYLRARYLNPLTGRFITKDRYTGDAYWPVSLHRYLYAASNPIDFLDPSGYDTERGFLQTLILRIATTAQRVGIPICVVFSKAEAYLLYASKVLQTISPDVGQYAEWAVTACAAVGGAFAGAPAPEPSPIIDPSTGKPVGTPAGPIIDPGTGGPLGATPEPAPIIDPTTGKPVGTPGGPIIDPTTGKPVGTPGGPIIDPGTGGPVGAPPASGPPLLGPNGQPLR